MPILRLEAVGPVNHESVVFRLTVSNESSNAISWDRDGSLFVWWHVWVRTDKEDVWRPVDPVDTGEPRPLGRSTVEARLTPIKRGVSFEKTYDLLNGIGVTRPDQTSGVGHGPTARLEDARCRFILPRDAAHLRVQVGYSALDVMHEFVATVETKPGTLGFWVGTVRSNALDIPLK